MRAMTNFYIVKIFIMRNFKDVQTDHPCGIFHRHMLICVSRVCFQVEFIASRQVRISFPVVKSL